MRAVRFHDHGGPEVLTVDEIDEPTPGARAVLVGIHAAGVNPVDTYFREGAYEPFELPMTPGIDFAGEVRETGDEVEGFAPGDRVYGTGIGRNHHGGYAECATVPTDRLVSLPDGVDTTMAGAAGVVGVTAWRALVDHAGLEPGETCLVHGGSGGVGHVAVQLAAAAGAQVLTTASPDYHDRLAELGADAVFDYSREDLAEAVEERASGVGGTDGVDVILDHRLDDYLQFDAEVAATGARVVGIGESDPAVGLENDGVARSKDVNYQFMSMFNTPDFRVPLARLARLVSAGDLTIDVAHEYELADAGEAQRVVLEESFLGKLVLVPEE
ncbi:NADPH:quinone reductase [Halococcus sediminicola]|uniref:NADPH:quinone reductase n=1 Tax=Halococcus sediminicola TaxID=1264579 RepID=UPI0006799896|nr:NADPH:quinone reductase [Halococcus sediminicola]